MKRKVLPVLLAAALALFPAAVSAAEPEVVGRWGIGNDKETAYADGSVDDSTDLWDVTATLYADGTLVLDGQGDTQNYSTVPTRYPEWYNDREQITKVEVRGNIKPDNADLLFFRLVNCTEIVGLENLDTSQATSIRSLFMECESLKTVDVSGLRTGNAKNMSSMFRDCFALERVDLSSLDTENCTNLANMFVNCRSLQEVLGLHIKGENVNAVKMFSNWYLSDIGPEALHKIEIRVDHEIKRPGLSLYQEVKKYAPDGSAYRFLGWYREQSPDFSGEPPQAYEKVSAEEGVWQTYYAVWEGVTVTVDDLAEAGGTPTYSIAVTGTVPVEDIAFTFQPAGSSETIEFSLPAGAAQGVAIPELTVREVAADGFKQLELDGTLTAKTKDGSTLEVKTVPGKAPVEANGGPDQPGTEDPDGGPVQPETPDSGAGTQPPTGDSRQLPLLLAGLLVSAGGIAVLVRKNTARR